MRIYLSGPMRGLPNQNLDEFYRVASTLRSMGHDVLNPAESRFGTTGSRKDYLREDCYLVLISDAVVVMNGWNHSPGANLEVALAWSIEIPVLLLAEHNGSAFLIPLPEVTATIPREHNTQPLVGLCGYARSGKDTFGAVLVRDNWTRVSFADPLKTIAADIGWDGEKDDAGRKLLQALGVSVRSRLAEDAWVRVAEERIERSRHPVVLTDVRFPNELALVRRRGGTLVWVERAGIGPLNGHISENAVSSADCDQVFYNDSDLDEVSEHVHVFMTGLKLAVAA